MDIVPTIGMPCPFEVPTLDATVAHDGTMLTDICSTPCSLRAVLDAYVGDGKVQFPVLNQPLPAEHAFAGKSPLDVMASCVQSDGGFPNRFVLVGSGTSLNAALVSEYLVEQVGRIPVEVCCASEYCNRKPIFRRGDILVLISASGETADVLQSLKRARSSSLGQQILTVAVVNEVQSTLASECDVCLDVHGGVEFGVTSTKVFSATVLTMALLSMVLGERRGTVSPDQMHTLIGKAQALPTLVSDVLRNELQALPQCRLWDVACHNALAQNFIFLGRGFNFPVALEGATKCKEVAYIHAEGYPAAEMKHGPIALIDQFMPVVVICPPSDPCYEKIISNLQEVKTRNGCVIAVTEAGNEELAKSCETVLYVPPTHEYFTPIVNVIPMQLLAYMMGTLRGNDVSNPRAMEKVRTSTNLQ